MNMKFLFSSFQHNSCFKVISLFYILAINKFVLTSVTIFDEKNTTLNNYDDLAANFGPNVPDDGFQGYISVGKPLDGCTKMEKPPNVSYVDPKSWIALIQRSGSKSNCTFDLKVYNAQQAGYSAVIVYNFGSDNLIKMSSSGLYSIKIPAVFIGESSGTEIKKYFTYQNKTYVRITSDDADLNYLLIPFVCVVSICFIVAIFIFIIKFAIHCHKIRKNRFPKSALKKIPTKKYQKTDKYDTCPICLNEYEEGVKMRILPCEHAYHIECIDKWLLRNNRACPVCKRKVIPGGSDSESEDSYQQSSTTIATNANLLDRQTEDNEPNEDDDTNESSRLLVSRSHNSNNNNNNDETSILTSSTQLMGTQNDISSLNNHMTTSINSNLTQQNNRTELRSSSSKYGSISSINQMTNSNSNNNINVNDDVNNVQRDSKATPSGEFFTPMSNISMDNNGLTINSVNELTAGSSSSFIHNNNNTNNNNSEKNIQLKSINTKSKSSSKSKKKNNKVASATDESVNPTTSSSNQIAKSKNSSKTKKQQKTNSDKIVNKKVEEEKNKLKSSSSPS